MNKVLRNIKLFMRCCFVKYKVTDIFAAQFIENSDSIDNLFDKEQN
jgi:hypothetical protein